jgi:hypothetical protein
MASPVANKSSQRTFYVHRTRGTVHETDCRWLEGSFRSNGKRENYETVSGDKIRRDAPRCPYCAPAVP